MWIFFLRWFLVPLLPIPRYGRANEAALASLMDVQDWQRIARQELERRATSIVQALDDATLEAIAAGTLDMRAMCRQVADEIHQIA